MQISVKKLSGETITLDVRAGERIEIVKQQLYRHEGVYPVHQRLIFGEVVLKDGRTLTEYNIVDKSTLYLIVLPGVVVGKFMRKVKKKMRVASNARFQAYQLQRRERDAEERARVAEIRRAHIAAFREEQLEYAMARTRAWAESMN
jgi:large subunit ribosomal protein L40e